MKFNVKIISFQNGKREQKVKFEQDLTQEEIIELIENYDWSEQIKTLEKELEQNSSFKDEMALFDIPYPDEIMIESEKYILDVTSIDSGIYSVVLRILGLNEDNYWEADFQEVSSVKRTLKDFLKGTFEKVKAEIVKNEDASLGKNGKAIESHLTKIMEARDRIFEDAVKEMERNQIYDTSPKKLLLQIAKSSVGLGIMLFLLGLSNDKMDLQTNLILSPLLSIVVSIFLVFILTVVPSWRLERKAKK